MTLHPQISLSRHSRERREQLVRARRDEPRGDNGLDDAAVWRESRGEAGDAVEVGVQGGEGGGGAGLAVGRALGCQHDARGRDVSGKMVDALVLERGLQGRGKIQYHSPETGPWTAYRPTLSARRRERSLREQGCDVSGPGRLRGKDNSVWSREDVQRVPMNLPRLPQGRKDAKPGTRVTAAASTCLVSPTSSHDDDLEKRSRTESIESIFAGPVPLSPSANPMQPVSSW
jgi:hypothetical protein